MSGVNDVWILESETDQWGNTRRVLEDMDGDVYEEILHEDGSVSFRMKD